jgi:hypothetical protein
LADIEWIFQRPFWSDPDYLSDLLTVGKICAEKTRTELQDINFGFGYSSSATGKHPNVEVWCGASSLEPSQNGIAPLVFLFHGSGFKPFGGKHLWKQYARHEVGRLRWGEFNDVNVPLRLRYNKVSERIISLGHIPCNNPDLLNRLRALEVPSSKETEFQQSRDEIGRESAERWKRIAGFSELIRPLQGSICAVCDCDIREGLQGAHILEVQDKGIETPENDLCLCYQHHAYWDKELFVISWGGRLPTASMCQSAGC